MEPTPPRCPFCDYDLSSIVGGRAPGEKAAPPRPRCPECGKRYPRTLYWTPVRWSPAAWGAIIAALLAPGVVVGSRIPRRYAGIASSITDAFDDLGVCVLTFLSVAYLIGLTPAVLCSLKLPRWQAGAIPATVAVMLANLVLAVVTHVVVAAFR